MKHYFIINPRAGKKSPENMIPAIESACVKLGVEYEIHRTGSKQECLEFVKKVTSAGQPVRLYAVGGDGTLNDVLNGIADFENTELGNIPCGTGNDFVKTVSSHAQMMALERYITAPSRRIDCLEACDQLCINICNVGVDANAAYYMQQIKRVPLLNGLAYYLGLGWAACHGLGTRMRVEFDDGEVIDRKLAIAVCGNGRYYGGSFLATPEASVDDGLIDVCLINEVNVFTFLQLVGKYKQGLHVHDEQMQKYVTYRTARCVTVSSPKAFRVSSDGEIVTGKSAVIRILPSKVRFLVPTEE